MSKYITSILLAASVVAISACTVRTTQVAEETQAQAGGEEFVIIEPAPISQEPVFTGKYK